MSDTLEQINKVFRLIFDNENLMVSEETSAEDVEKWDSFKHIISMPEKEFNIGFDIDQIASLENVGDMIRVV